MDAVELKTLNGAFDYKKHLREFTFITNTLEFVFAASDLLDLGWTLKTSS
ncbi:hypothetical protein EV681_0803 [Advenella incenata]|uniref:Uncharacterized protein n=1 Tax=Advenella incenata TaxID=267800 RepID=A0A4Q7VRG7_9BURK|nr:hypothetical protein EV681_0803 [Advenella incenata]